MAVPFPNFGSYEWLLPFADVKHVFQDLPLRTEGTVLTVVVGCGTSDLSRELHTHLGLPQVVSIDNDEEVVSHMKAQHEDLKAALSFHQADLTAPCSHVVADGAADLVVDKSTLDCLLCSEGAPKLVHNIYRMLRVGGCYVVISFHQKEFLMSLLSLAFSIESAIDLQRDVGPDVLALVLRKGTEELPELQKALEAWNVQMPKDLMSETRREALEAPQEKQQLLPEDLPERFYVNAWIPQAELVQRPELLCVLTHCGWGGTLECMLAGKAVICYAGFGDQFENAKLMNARGCGPIVSDPPRSTAKDIQAAVEDVLENQESYSANARKVSQDLHASPGPTAVAERIEDVVKNGMGDMVPKPYHLHGPEGCQIQ